MQYGEELSQKFYNAIEARCPAIDLGRKVLTGKNFTTDPGPWTGPLIAELAAKRQATQAAAEAAAREPAPLPAESPVPE